MVVVRLYGVIGYMMPGIELWYMRSYCILCSYMFSCIAYICEYMCTMMSIRCRAKALWREYCEAQREF